eukprot:575056-Rhodomonas_salina.1
MPGTAYAPRACGGVTLRASYAVSGTDLAYGEISLRASYAMSGTELAYGRRSGRCRSPWTSRTRTCNA